jgi:hypothetical protein
MKTASRPAGRANRSRVVRPALSKDLTRLERAAEQKREIAVVRQNRARLARQASALLQEQAKP